MGRGCQDTTFGVVRPWPKYLNTKTNQCLPNCRMSGEIMIILTQSTTCLWQKLLCQISIERTLYLLYRANRLLSKQRVQVFLLGTTARSELCFLGLSPRFLALLSNDQAERSKVFLQLAWFLSIDTAQCGNSGCPGMLVHFSGFLAGPVAVVLAHGLVLSRHI